MAYIVGSFAAGVSGSSPQPFDITASGNNVRICAGVIATGGDVIISCTHDGQAMTQQRKINAGGWYIYFYTRDLASTSGTKQVNVTVSAGTIYAFGAAYDDVLGNDAIADSSSFGVSPLDLPLTTVADNSWIVAIAFDGGGGDTPTAGTGTTKRGGHTDYTGFAWFDSGGGLSPAGAKNLQLNVDTADNYQWIIASFEPAGGAPGDPNAVQTYSRLILRTRP